MVVFVLAGVFVTTKTAIGTQIYGLGGNEQVLKNAGIDTAKIKLFVFSMSGFCAAAAGVLLARSWIPRIRRRASPISSTPSPPASSAA